MKNIIQFPGIRAKIDDNMLEKLDFANLIVGLAQDKSWGVKKQMVDGMDGLLKLAERAYAQNDRAALAIWLQLGFMVGAKPSDDNDPNVYGV